MSISFACPSCQRKLKVPDASAGKSGKCPGCGLTVDVPRPSEPVEIGITTEEYEDAPSEVPSASSPDPNPSYLAYVGLALGLASLVANVFLSIALFMPGRSTASASQPAPPPAAKQAPQSPEPAPMPPPDPEFAKTMENAPPEVQVTALQIALTHAPSDLTIERMHFLLTRAADLYSEDVGEIASLTIKAWEDLRKAGMDTDPALILQGSSEWIGPAYFKNGVSRRFREYYAVYTATRMGSPQEPSHLSHEEALHHTRIVAHEMLMDVPPKTRSR